MTTAVFLGIDIGTSGIRGCCINTDGDEIASFQLPLKNKPCLNGKNEQDPLPWLASLEQILAETTQKVQTLENDCHIAAISIDGTSSTLIACKQDGTPLSPALMYNDQQSQQQAQVISQFAPTESAVHSASSSLAKALNLLEKYPETQLFCHQADWLASHLTGNYGISDENNCLKLGYDSITQQWPDWLHENKTNLTIQKNRLPKVVAPGTKLGTVKADIIKKFGLTENCSVIAGTTDSNAAVLATGANQLGDAVTSLGSTLVVKLFSQQPLFLPEYGIYSHRLNNHWLVGGASNSGGSVLLQHFTQTQLDDMTPQLNPNQLIDLNYYPLPSTGERFPTNDVNKQSKIVPRPKNDVAFFQALLEGISNIEADAYKKLISLGATSPRQIFTAGGGSQNSAWTKLRQNITNIPVVTAQHTEASYGSALLAKQGYLNN